MRIAIVSDAWRPQIDGVVRTVETIVRLLRGAGHEVEVFGPDRFRTIPCPTYSDIPLSLLPRRTLVRMIEAFQPEHVERAAHVDRRGDEHELANAFGTQHRPNLVSLLACGP